MDAGPDRERRNKQITEERYAPTSERDVLNGKQEKELL